MQVVAGNEGFVTLCLHIPIKIYIYIYIYIYGPGSSIVIAVDYGLDGPGSNPGGTKFSVLPYRPWVPPSLL